MRDMRQSLSEDNWYYVFASSRDFVNIRITVVNVNVKNYNLVFRKSPENVVRTDPQSDNLKAGDLHKRRHRIDHPAFWRIL